MEIGEKKDIEIVEVYRDHVQQSHSMRAEGIVRYTVKDKSGKTYKTYRKSAPQKGKVTIQATGDAEWTQRVKIL